MINNFLEQFKQDFFSFSLKKHDLIINPFRFYFHNSYIHASYNKKLKSLSISHIFLEEELQHKGILKEIINYLRLCPLLKILSFSNVCNPVLEDYLIKNNYIVYHDLFAPYTPSYSKTLNDV